MIICLDIQKKKRMHLVLIYYATIVCINYETYFNILFYFKIITGRYNYYCSYDNRCSNYSSKRQNM